MCSTKQSLELQTQTRRQQQNFRKHAQCNHLPLKQRCSPQLLEAAHTVSVCTPHGTTRPACTPAAEMAPTVAPAAADLPQDASQPRRSTAQHKRGRTATPQATAVQQVKPDSTNMGGMGGMAYPRLSRYPTTIDSRQRLLCEVLQYSAAEVQLLMVNSQHITALNRQQLVANWAQLQQLLPVPKPQLLLAMLQLPDLLAQPQDVVHMRLSEAADVLQVPLQQLRSDYVTGRNISMVPQLHFQLLLLSKQQLFDKLLQLTQTLGLEGQQAQRTLRGRQQQEQQQQLWLQRQRKLVVSLILGEPELLRVEQPQLLSSVEALEELCAWPVERLLPGIQHEPRLLVTPAEQLYAAAADLQQLLRLSEQGLAPVLRSTPAVLLVPSGQLSALLQELAAGLGASVELAADILLQEPSVLLRRPGAVSAVLGVLRSTFKLGHEGLLQVVEFDPSVLCCSPGELTDSTSKFQSAALKHKAWAVEYRHLMSRPVNVARALRIEPLRLLRLTYLQRMRQAARVSLKAAVSMSGRQFVQLFPGYQDWLAQHYSAGGVPITYRLEYIDEESDEDEE